MMRTEDDPQSRVLYELSSMIIHILRYPSPVTIPFPVTYSHGRHSSGVASSSSSMRRGSWSWPSTTPSQISPAAFASLFLGISMAMMLFGWVTFLIGFILMPWVIGLVLIFYLAGVVSNLSQLGRSLLCWALPPQDLPAWKCL